MIAMPSVAAAMQSGACATEEGYMNEGVVLTHRFFVPFLFRDFSLSPDHRMRHQPRRGMPHDKRLIRPYRAVVVDSDTNANVVFVVLLQSGRVYAWNGEIRARDAAVEKGRGVAGKAGAAHAQASCEVFVERVVVFVVVCFCVRSIVAP